MEIAETDQADETIPQVLSLEQHEDDEHDHETGGGKWADQRQDEIAHVS